MCAASRLLSLAKSGHYYIAEPVIQRLFHQDTETLHHSGRVKALPLVFGLYERPGIFHCRASPSPAIAISLC
jgi:hypothetical protein